MFVTSPSAPGSSRRNGHPVDAVRPRLGAAGAPAHDADLSPPGRAARHHERAAAVALARTHGALFGGDRWRCRRSAGRPPAGCSAGSAPTPASDRGFHASTLPHPVTTERAPGDENGSESRISAMSSSCDAVAYPSCTTKRSGTAPRPSASATCALPDGRRPRLPPARAETQAAPEGARASFVRPGSGENCPGAP